MKEHGLLCTSSVALAMHEGRQTQDRRPMKPQPDWYKDGVLCWKGKVALLKDHDLTVQVGDIFYVREPVWLFGHWEKNGLSRKRHQQSYKFVRDEKYVDYDYGSGAEMPKSYIADRKTGDQGWVHQPGMFMPKKYSRIRKRVTGIRVEHGPEISEKDAIAEGAEVIDRRDGLGRGYKHGGRVEWQTASESFRALWHDIYGDDKPWRWVYELEDAGK